MMEHVRSKQSNDQLICFSLATSKSSTDYTLRHSSVNQSMQQTGTNKLDLPYRTLAPFGVLSR